MPETRILFKSIKKRIIPLTIASKRIKHLGINVTEGEYDFHRVQNIAERNWRSK